MSKIFIDLLTPAQLSCRLEMLRYISLAEELADYLDRQGFQGLASHIDSVTHEMTQKISEVQ